MEASQIQLFNDVRTILNNWRSAMPQNFFSEDANLVQSLRYWLGQEKFQKFEGLFTKAGEHAANQLNTWAQETNRDENLPQLNRFGAHGSRVEEVIFHPKYHEMGELIYGSGIMAHYAERGNDVAQLALFYLFAQNGEAGHCCPLACTAGAIKLISRVGSKELKDKYLQHLLNPDYKTHMHASQFLTELQGGSDVGANATRAVEASDGSWRLYGEKWFCSVIDAQLWVLTARPENAPAGTKGLMTFIAPRYLEDGTVNNFTLNRLKYKVGTRSMASAEISLDGLVAYPLGSTGEGFKNVVEIVLNTSRLFNAFAAAGFTRRAYVEAVHFAKNRDAFGHKIQDFPLIKRSLALLKTQSAVQLATSMHIAQLEAARSRGTASEDDQKVFRFLVNANKYVTSISCTHAVHEAVEVFGGNGTIEEFSVLPRLYRDALVIESWEGTHNVLCLQVLRDMHRYQIHIPVLSRAKAVCQNFFASDFKPEAELMISLLITSEEKSAQLLAMPEQQASADIRPWLDYTMSILQGVDLLKELAFELASGVQSDKREILKYHLLQNAQKVDRFNNKDFIDLENKMSH